MDGTSIFPETAPSLLDLNSRRVGFLRRGRVDGDAKGFGIDRSPLSKTGARDLRGSGS
jgi:hypothetical protein